MKKLFLLAALCMPVAAWSASECVMPQDDTKSEVGGLHLESISDAVSSFHTVGYPKERVYFYTVPLDNCKTDKFIIVGDKVNANALFGDYMNVTYTNPKTDVNVKGWVRKTQLEQSSNDAISTVVKKITGGVGSTASGIKNYTITCLNNENYDVMYMDDKWSDGVLVDEPKNYDIKTPSVKNFAEQFCKLKIKK